MLQVTATWFTLLLSAAAGAEPKSPPELTAETLRKSVERALPLLAKGAEGHIAQRTCFACHNQALPILAFTTARERGLVNDDSEYLNKQLKFIATFLDGNRENYAKGKGQGGQVDTAGYALLALERGGWKPDATTTAVVEYLLLRNNELDHWRTTSNRPPSEVSNFTPTYLALRSLRVWGMPEQKERIAKRVETVRDWLVKTSAKDTEDRVFRLWALKEAGAGKEQLADAVDELVESQRKDGGWGQRDSMDSDAYATGSALVALREAGGVATDDPVYQRGLTFLIQSQQEDGSWLVRSRSTPFQVYYESGFPHGKDQFISMAASGWAASAVALACASREKPTDLPARQAAKFKVTARKNDDTVVVHANSQSVVLVVNSASGIGSAVVERVEETWPRTVTLQLRLKGLESFHASDGKITLAAAVASAVGKPRARQWIDGKEDSGIDEKSPLWMDIRVLEGNGKPAAKIPVNNGMFELTLPRAFFDGNPKSFSVEWIDFYR